MVINNESKIINDNFLSMKLNLVDKSNESIRKFIKEFYKNKRFKNPIVLKEDIIEGYSIGIRRYIPEFNNLINPIILYVHGGGFYFGDLDYVDDFVSDMCLNCKAEIYSIDYRKAPEYRFPVAHQDVSKFVEFFLEQKKDHHRPVYLMGTSSGSMLILDSMLNLNQEFVERISGLILDSPAIDLNTDYDSFKKYNDGYFLDTRSFKYYMKNYYQNQKVHINSENLKKIKNCLIISCGIDPLKDQAFDFEKNLKTNGVSVVHEHFENQLHGFNYLYYSYDVGIDLLPHWKIINDFIDSTNRHDRQCIC